MNHVPLASFELADHAFALPPEPPKPVATLPAVRDEAALHLFHLFVPNCFPPPVILELTPCMPFYASLRLKFMNCSWRSLTFVFVLHAQEMWLQLRLIDPVVHGTSARESQVLLVRRVTRGSTGLLWHSRGDSRLERRARSTHRTKVVVVKVVVVAIFGGFPPLLRLATVHFVAKLPSRRVAARSAEPEVSEIAKCVVGRLILERCEAHDTLPALLLN